MDVLQCVAMDELFFPCRASLDLPMMQEFSKAQNNRQLILTSREFCIQKENS